MKTRVLAKCDVCEKEGDAIVGLGGIDIKDGIWKKHTMPPDGWIILDARRSVDERLYLGPLFIMTHYHVTVCSEECLLSAFRKAHQGLFEDDRKDCAKLWPDSMGVGS